MNVFPLKFRQWDDGSFLFADDAGGFFRSDETFLIRYAKGMLTDEDLSFLEENGHVYRQIDDYSFNAFMYRWAKRLYAPGDLDYVILVPTLRCNLSCGYCQVSRVNENTPGFDWDETTLQATLKFLDSLKTTRMKVEFQGGEPLLRIDLLERVREFCRKRFDVVEFVVCTNLHQLGTREWAFISADDTYVSTSLDANASVHQRQRTITAERTAEFFGNLRRAIDILGPSKVSALPTLDVRNLPDPRSVIESFTSFEMRSIYLRPVNYQGFARKQFQALDSAVRWNAYHAEFIDAMIDYNWTANEPVEEYYFVHCLRRVLRSGHNGHSDLRNPNVLGQSYLVIDHDGVFYPTDEARMVTRIGRIDLSMGNVRTGLSSVTVDALNAEATNNLHPDCVHCSYQPFCGVDLVDDLSRYGRIDMPKHDTDFCRRHTHLFDKVFELIYSEDPKVRKSVAIWAGMPEYDPAIAKVHA
ncbi:His-Xaa-Ser system radical SAM maturase HxsB [Rhizobium flavescens]|uniref:His-Xaa-Ser system radical SAM maturase HxsB n=1 Tax=Rhizobium flavescens TaxID=2607407 RepID=UPI00140A23D6|nr:His-Xaa-Ser system radical SAM maturase HxsB [Rhizobium flavescens]